MGYPSLDSFSLIHESLIAEDLSLPQLRFRSPSSDISNLSQAYHRIKGMGVAWTVDTYAYNKGSQNVSFLRHNSVLLSIIMAPPPTF